MKKLALLVVLAFFSLSPLYAKIDGVDGVNVSSSGSTRDQVRGVTFIFSSDFSGTVGGITFSGATDSSFTPPIPPNDTFGPIAYTVSAGSIRIMYVQ